MSNVEREYEKKYFLLMKDDFEERLASQSGGAFVALSDVVIKEGGVVYGAVLTENLSVEHSRATTPKERDAMRGSKYTQSYLGDIFQDVKNDLIEGRTVLFSGVSCQVAGLKAYLEGFDSAGRLITVDLLCHGCPSQKVFKSFVNYREKQKGAKVISVNFRNKVKYGWQSHIETVEYEDGTSEDSYIYTKVFHSEAMQKPSCRNCPFHSQDRPSDITIADAWGAIKENPELVDNNGLSLVLCNSEAGYAVLRKVDSCFIKEIELKGAFLEGPISKDYDTPAYSSKLWKTYFKKEFEGAYEYVSRINLSHRTLNKARSYLEMRKKEFKPLKKDDPREKLASQTYINEEKANTKIKLPILYKTKNECMGCGACYNKCKDIKGAIAMKEDAKGFYYPVVDASKCIGCHSCERACPFKKYDKR